MSGPGAGEGPTASAIVGDVIDIARGLVIPAFGRPAASLAAPQRATAGAPAAYYLRFLLADAPGTLAQVAAALGAAGISINRMRQVEHAGPEAPVLIVTHRTERAPARRGAGRDRPPRGLPRRTGRDPHRGALMQAAIRPATPADAEAIAAIYAHHVLHGTATFEEVPPDPAEIARRQAEITGRGLPYLVAEADGRLLGYAYAGRLRPRSAYRFTLEDSIYLDPAATGRGLGRRLLDRLIADCTADRRPPARRGDRRQRQRSPRSRCTPGAGFAHVGTLRSVGLKFGRWLDTVEMQRPLGDGDATLP